MSKQKTTFIIFRFITPILITIVLYMVGIIRNDLKDVQLHMKNHLSEHKDIEVTLEKRLTRIETLLDRINGNGRR